LIIEKFELYVTETMLRKRLEYRSQRAAEEIRGQQRKIQNALCGPQFLLCGSPWAKISLI
jgi:hypothetical protein